MMNCNSSTCQKMQTPVGVLRILLGAAMVFFGAMKFGATPEMQTMVGGAGHQLGLTFLSVTTWFWIAVIGEILSGLLLLSGCKVLSKVGAILALIIMVFAVNAVGFNLNAILIIIASLIILVAGPGKWCFCKCASCKGGACCGKGSCDTTSSKSEQQQEQE